MTPILGVVEGNGGEKPLDVDYTGKLLTQCEMVENPKLYVDIVINEIPKKKLIAQ